MAFLRHKKTFDHVQNKGSFYKLKHKGMDEILDIYLIGYKQLLFLVHAPNGLLL